ncbi:constitutive coactivator of peroxisome proliferator-activated receptor gamma isoform X2 [Denticeps clupeoides]|uniref:constitutive coactivator of peroxisome proliferator-activated receptor gamma isoform X2 n=1 Tax=Denticeps clupeoides TaxID=299321 RepID=UPI0010A358F2|nr:constitutive coactivator of peroxisome proliferator-activated receptor gamma isoform X2 [Denticeps clupeoides]
MGVRGLSNFTETCCPETCVNVDLRQMAADHRKSRHGGAPTLAVDGMACLRHWYGCSAWVHGGQWKEYVRALEGFCAAFSAAGIRLVFFFDGTVEERKRPEWVRRRLSVNKDVAKVFKHIRCHGQQPGRDMFLIPPALATFSQFALKDLGQEVRCSVQEGDYEIASYANAHNCMGILAQDSDFLIYNTAPYLSVAKLSLATMTTVLFSREKLCGILQLQQTDLPVLACVLGNDTVPVSKLKHVHSNAIRAYREKGLGNWGEKVFALADFVRGFSALGAAACLPLCDSVRDLVLKGMQSYVLPGQSFPWANFQLSSPKVCVMEKFVNVDVLQAAKQKHMGAECIMVYNLLFDGAVECSNTFEDEENSQLPPQALVFQPIRENIYGLLLQPPSDRSSEIFVKEWFVFPGNSLKEPRIISPKPFTVSGRPDLKVLWFNNDPESRRLSLSTFMALLDLERYDKDFYRLDGPLMAVFCLVTYMALQVRQLVLEDLNAYLSQAVCIKFKSHTELQQSRVSHVDPRAVQLGSLFIRGLTHLVAANSACGSPFNMEDLMPWRTFDGLLFHSKYLMAHCSSTPEDLLEGNASWISQFQSLRDLVLEACTSCGRTMQSSPQNTRPGGPTNKEDFWKDRRPHYSGTPGHCGSSLQNNSQYSRRPPIYVQEHQYKTSTRHPNRGKYHLAPRWPQHNPRPDRP